MRITALFLTLSALLSGCNETTNMDGHLDSAQAKDPYTCSMHPQVIQDRPGTCPICGMKLVKLSGVGVSGSKIVLNDTQMTLANITTGVVRKESLGETIGLNGVLTVDERKREVISSRIGGRIEKLFVKETGRFVVKGEPLYVLYSESLLTLQQEYLMAREQSQIPGETQKRYRSYMDAAKRKLLLYGLTEKQIANLTDRTALQPTVTFVASASGIATEVLVSEGQYVGEGAALYHVDDTRSLWVEAEVYPNEISRMKKGNTVTVKISGFENPAVGATVTFLSPEYKSNTQVVVLRAQIDNPEFRYKPGQEAQVYFTESTRNVVSLPTDAVIRNGEGSHVYVQSGRNTFEPRMVKTGQEGFNNVEITEGVEEGDTVAVTGAYLLYSELVLKKGGNPMAGHVH